MALNPTIFNMNRPLGTQGITDRVTQGRNALLDQTAAQQRINQAAVMNPLLIKQQEQINKARGMDIEQAAVMNPLLIQQQEQINQASGMDIQQAEQQRELQSMYAGWKSIKPYISNANPELNDVETAQKILAQRYDDIVKRGGDPSDTLEMMQAIGKGDFNYANAMGSQLEALANPQGAKTAAIRAFEATAAAAGLKPGMPEYIQAAKVELGIVPRAGESAAERIAKDKELSAQVAASEAQKAGAVEGAKQEQQLKYKPKIAEAVRIAEDSAKSRGETLTALQRSQAALPGLEEAVGDLRELAKIATSTFGGKLFDQAVKQTGFGATKGATARTKFIAIVNNQVLPLLRETFGAAFTAQEGESLKATMGDPDASPEEKMAQLDAFIAQKKRDIETKERELGMSGEQTANQRLDELRKKAGL